MLQLKNIKKDYLLKGQEPVHALKGINLTFRQNEFVSILGPSGCGKTTLLNIIGGLDRYTSGDLVIEGKSTKKYDDRDWDTYRNHSIGFVFQSYNLISHQTILANVELALTISGISKQERTRRAKEALDKVGLAGMYKKRPNQMSGGQMQRVAIARSLVNNPEILLADEPTGALDSETSIQIMDILQEVAKDRLVIMVTHNPDLAEKYSTRIVSMKDGVVLGDTMPYEGESKKEMNERLKLKEQVTESKGKKAKTSMSLLTAGALSFANLRSKLKRTILVTIAGSIGIIGVSAVLAVSTGVNDYIYTMQDDMLSSYPITISETSVDYAALMTGLSNYDAKKIPEFDLRSEVGVDSMITYLMDKYKDITSVKTNDINPDLLRFIEAAPEGSYSSLLYNYGIDMTNNIFTEFDQGKRLDNNKNVRMMSLNGLTQMYISELRTVENFGEYAMFVDLFTDFLKPLPSSAKQMGYIASQYDLVGTGSRMPQNDNELVIVVDDNQTLTDLLYAQMGFYSESEFLDIAREAISTHDDETNKEELANKKFEYPYKFTFDEILGKKLTYYPHQTIYSYQSINETRVKFEIPNLLDPTDPTSTIKFNLVYNDKCDSLIGNFVSPSLGSLSCILTRPSGESGTDENGNWVWNISSYGVAIPFTVAGGSVSLMFLDSDNHPQTLSVPYVKADEVTSGYMYEADAKESWSGKEEVKIVGILKKKPNINFGCLSRGAYYTQEFANKFIDQNKNSDVIASKVTDQLGITEYIKANGAKEEEEFATYVKYEYTSFIKGEENPVYDVAGYANALNSDLSSSLGAMMSIRKKSAYDNDKSHLRSLCGLASKIVSNPDLPGKPNYEFDKLPQSISIYPNDFKSKDQLTKYLDTWNDKKDIELPAIEGLDSKNLADGTRDELTYNDTVEMIITMINTLVTTITVALVAFTSLSLVVSSFMIAVITYISVVERTKEIGVIRSLGGRKRDVSRLFIAETFMTGLLSGSFGIAVTYIFQIIFNIALTATFGITNMANLTPITALIMISISIILSVVSGLVPSMKASNQDPVLALRSE